MRPISVAEQSGRISVSRHGRKQFVCSTFIALATSRRSRSFISTTRIYDISCRTRAFLAFRLENFPCLKPPTGMNGPPSYNPGPSAPYAPSGQYGEYGQGPPAIEKNPYEGQRLKPKRRINDPIFLVLFIAQVSWASRAIERAFLY